MISFNHTSGRCITIDDVEIYYEEIGNSQKPALILLHGGFGNLEDFNVLLPFLTDTFYIVGVDSRAQGRSTLGKQKLTYERIQHDVEAIVKHLGINKMSIIGFSDGGIVAYRLASFTTLQIEKLITVDSRWNISDALLTENLLRKVTANSWKEKFPQMYSSYQRLNPEPDFNLLTTSIVNMWLDSTSTGHPNEKVANINCPTLIVRGDNDHLLTAQSVAELKTHIKKSTLLNIPFAGHVAYQDQLEVFTNIFLQFMSGKN